MLEALPYGEVWCVDFEFGGGGGNRHVLSALPSDRSNLSPAGRRRFGVRFLLRGPGWKLAGIPILLSLSLSLFHVI